MGRAPKFDDDEILDRAMAVFWRHGWSTTSIRDLEVGLDLKAPSIYRRFGSKDLLGAAVVDHYVERVIGRRVATHLNGSGDPLANLRRFLESSVTQTSDTQRLWGCLVTTTALEVDSPGPELAGALRRGSPGLRERKTTAGGRPRRG